MTINEILLFAKILAFASGDRTVTVTDLDKKMAADALKRMADQRYDTIGQISSGNNTRCLWMWWVR